MAQRKTDRELLDEALRTGRSADSIVEEARNFARKRMVVDDARDAAGSARAEERERQTLKPIATVKRYASPVLEGIKAAALPASFLGGPVGMAAGGYYALQGLDEAIEDPSVGNAAMAGLGVLPFVKPVKAAMAASRTAKDMKNIRSTYGAGDMGATFSREVPYRAGGGAASGPRSAPPKPDPQPHTPQGYMGVIERMKQQLESLRPESLTVQKPTPGIIPDDILSRMDEAPNPSAPFPKSQRQSIFDDGEKADREWFAAQGPAKSRVVPPVQRVPPGARGDEYAEIRANGGAFDKRNTELSPEELAGEDEFWEVIAKAFGR